MFTESILMTENKDRIRYTFAKDERLCHQKSIDRLFAEGKSFIAYPLRVVYLTEKDEVAERQISQVLISVAKRKFKRANKRNRVKRLVREAYRLNKPDLIDALQSRNLRMTLAFLYLKDELPTYEEIEKSILKMVATLKEKIGEESL